MRSRLAVPIFFAIGSQSTSRRAAAGSAVNTGSEQGFASLVDLRSGEIVWFNVVNDGGGELRDEGGAAAAVDALFRDIPVSQNKGIPVAQDDTG